MIFFGNDEEERAKRVRASGQEETGESFFVVLMKALLLFFKQALFPDKNAPDFEGSTPQQRQQAEREYVVRQKEEEKLPKYADSVPSLARAPVVAADYASKLQKLRKEAEQTNGGEHIHAIVPVAGNGRVTDDYGHRHAPHQKRKYRS